MRMCINNAHNAYLTQIIFAQSITVMHTFLPVLAIFQEVSLLYDRMITAWADKLTEMSTEYFLSLY